MPDQLSNDLLELKSACLKLVNETILPLADAPASDARAVIRAASKAAGIFEMTQPKEFGGSAAGQLALCVARETLASTNPPHMDCVFGPSPGVLGHVADPLRTSHLAPLLAGEKRASFGFTEADNAPQPTHGIIKGDELVITGQKSYVTGGADADFINTLVHIEDRGPSMVVIDRNYEGVSIEKKFTSLDGSHHAVIAFNQVRVPITHIIGDPGSGLPKAMRQIGDTRLLFAAQACGYMIWVINYLTEHLKQHDKSGAPRGDKDVIRLRYADLRVQAFAARSMIYRTARLADSGENIVNEAMTCKLFATEAVGNIVDVGIQLTGGAALVEGHPLERLYRQVRAWRLAEGASDILRLNIGRGILELGKGRI